MSSNGTKQDVASRVADMFRIAEARDDMTLKRLEALSGVPYESLNGYRRGASMPLHVFVAISQHIADDLLSLCVEPANKGVVTNDIPDGGPHELARDASEYNVTYLDSINPTSEAGQSLSPRERARLEAIRRRMAARRVA